MNDGIVTVYNYYLEKKKGPLQAHKNTANCSIGLIAQLFVDTTLYPAIQLAVGLWT